MAAIEATPLAANLRVSRWGYAAINACHILGISLLVGSIVPLDLRLLGLWRTVPRAQLARVLVPVAAFGLVLAGSTGVLLFSVRATEYADITVFQIKLALVVLGASAAILLHLRHGRWLASASRPTLVIHALMSMACWIGALALGRLIAFVTG